jgi:hypothetical protein
MFASSEEIETLTDGEAGYKSTELYHPATDNDSRMSFEIPDEEEIDEADMGNILINASIG